MTKIEQKIPEGWSVDEFGNIALLSKKKYIPSPNEHIKCIELEHFEKETGRLNGCIDSAQQSSTKNCFKTGDVLYGKLRPYLKKYTQASFDGVCSTEIWVLQGYKEKLTNSYLYLIIQSNKFNVACNVSTGTHMPRADWEYVSNIPFIFPPLVEQEKIAGILSCWDDGIEKLSALIEKKKIQKKALMQQLLTGKHRLKGFSSPWHEVKLGDISKISTGESNREDSSLNGKYTFFDRSQDVRTSNRYLFDGEAIIVAGEGQDFIPKYFVGKFDLHQRSYCIMNFKNIFGKFLFFLLNLNKNYFLQQAVGSTVKSLRLPMFLKMKLYVPSDLAEQKAIAEILSKADEEIELLNKKLEAFKQEKKALMQQLLTGKIRVKVN